LASNWDAGTTTGGATASFGSAGAVCATACVSEGASIGITVGVVGVAAGVAGVGGARRETVGRASLATAATCTGWFGLAVRYAASTPTTTTDSPIEIANIFLFVRHADLATSAVRLWSTAVWVLGDVDLGPLDLFGHRQMFKLPWKTYDPDSLRGFFAQLTADLDAHFDTCAAWPGGVTTDEVIDNREYNYRVRQRVYRYASGAYAIELAELLAPGALDGTGWLTIKVEGLPWGHSVRARIDSTDHPVWGVEGWIDLNLPRAQLDATLARLAAIPGLERK
jgi:hypothetical protein